MKRIITISILIFVLGTIVMFQAMRPAEIYGDPFKVGPATALRDIVDNPDRFLAADVRTSGRIVRQCPSSGCWFFLDDGTGRQVRVELGHLGMKFPQHIGGTAEVEGRLTRDGKNLELVGNGVRFLSRLSGTR